MCEYVFWILIDVIVIWETILYMTVDIKAVTNECIIHFTAK